MVTGNKTLKGTLPRARDFRQGRAPSLLCEAARAPEAAPDKRCVRMPAPAPVEEMWSPQLLGGLQGDSVSPGVEGM